jgi:hypothetical protein
LILNLTKFRKAWLNLLGEEREKKKKKNMRVTRLGCGLTKLEVKLGWAAQSFDYNKKYKFLKICFKMGCIN